MIKIKSVWENNAKTESFPSLENDIKTDVLIIGGGMAGVLTAYFLHQKGVNYILVEKDKICSKTTAGTTAKITYQHGFIYDKLLRNNGYDTAKTYLDANLSAFNEYSKICENIECDYELKDNYVYTLSEINKAEKECETLNSLGIAADLLLDSPLPFDIKAAVRVQNQAQFNPLKFIDAISRELNIYENTFVKEMNGCTAVTDRGKIKAEKIIVTTHFPFINKHGLYSLKLYQHRSYVLALDNACLLNGMYVDECDTGLSFRNYGDLLLLGGGGHRTGKKGGNWVELRGFATKNYPNANEKYFWATQDCMSLDSMPYIGNYSANTPNMYVAAGFNKWGMTGSMLSAMILADLICERYNEFAQCFSPSRSFLTPQLFVNGFESATNLLKFSKPRCSHLGCALKWNKTEHSWDCPCHGSRFDKVGKIIDNPAKSDIKHL